MFFSDDYPASDTPFTEEMAEQMKEGAKQLGQAAADQRDAFILKCILRPELN